MAWSPIQPKKEENRKNSAVRVGSDREMGEGRGGGGVDKIWKRKKFFSKNSCGYLKKISIKANMATDEGNSPN